MIITVARKPFPQTIIQSCLTSACGAIQIDACRVGSGTGETLTVMVPDHRSFHYDGQDTQAYKDRAKLTIQRVDNGRFPTNILLTHTEACLCTGTREVPGYSINRWVDGSKPFGGGAGHAYETTKTATPETILTWACAESCVVCRMDQQSGIRPGMSGGGATLENANKKTGREAIPDYKRKPSTPFIRSDTGGASRFFKHVGKVDA